MQNLRVAVDVGGTFTDICIMDDTTGLIRIEKTASSKDPIDAIMSGLDKAAIDLGKVALFSHGTTVATNALITRRLPRTAMVCTKGFRDVIVSSSPSAWMPRAPSSLRSMKLARARSPTSSNAATSRPSPFAS